MSYTKRFVNLALIIIIACSTILFVANATGQKQLKSVEGTDVKTMLFKDTDAAMQAAKKVQADILAPENFGKAMKLYQKAAADLKEGKKLEDIQKKLSESTVFFQEAINATKLAEVTFPNSMKARKDAQKSESAKFSSKLWTEAEKKFNEAASELEDGDVNNAREKSAEAEQLYRHAEVDAIKANYLDGTRELLKQAEELDVKDRAPKTLRLAQQFVQQAEKEINENRYDTDVARSLAQHANYEAKHAIYLSKAIKQMKDKKNTWEDVMLASEKSLQQIAEKTDLVASFDTGPGKTTDEIIGYVTRYQDSVARLSQNLDQYNQAIYLQRARIAEMEQQLGSEAKEKSSLAQQIANQAKAHEQFANLEKSFPPEEARVLREDNNIIIRLVGLNFPSAKATIEQQSFGLLTKVRDAINAFPECTISVLGNTDSHGSDVKNMQLSQERAEAVKQYLLANTKLNPLQIEAIGYGENKPIASNETITGRAANRRVDVVIHPEMTGTLSDADSIDSERARK